MIKVIVGDCTRSIDHASKCIAFNFDKLLSNPSKSTPDHRALEHTNKQLFDHFARAGRIDLIDGRFRK